MFARTLERVLTELAYQSDVSRYHDLGLSERFRLLRGAHLLPRGRENRFQRLSNTQISSAILSLAPPNPREAMLASVTLAGLLPAGGTVASYRGAETLGAAVVMLIQDASDLVRLTLTMAETGTNWHGEAWLVYAEEDGTKRVSTFVSQFAGSSLDTGGEAHISHQDNRYAPTSRDFVIVPSFFHELAREIRLSSHVAAPPGDGEEYTVEEEAEERRRRLGVQSHSRYLSIPVDHKVAWPRIECLIDFDDYQLVLLPRTKDHESSIHIDLHHFRLSMEEGQTVVNRFLSLMCWVDDQRAITKLGMAGSGTPHPVPAHRGGFTTASHWVFDRNIPENPDAQKALALYRDGVNASTGGLVSHAVLSFYRILEIKFDGRAISDWVQEIFPQIRETFRHAGDVFSRFDEIRGNQAEASYLYQVDRTAVAHFSRRSPSDPDDASDVKRLHMSADILRFLARHCIEHELGVSTKRWEEIDMPIEPYSGG